MGFIAMQYNLYRILPHCTIDKLSKALMARNSRAQKYGGGGEFFTAKRNFCIIAYKLRKKILKSLKMVEPMRVELTTSAVRLQRSPN